MAAVSSHLLSLVIQAAECARSQASLPPALQAHTLPGPRVCSVPQGSINLTQAKLDAFPVPKASTNQVRVSRDAPIVLLISTAQMDIWSQVSHCTCPSLFAYFHRCVVI
jgi:hypothetical protein